MSAGSARACRAVQQLVHVRSQLAEALLEIVKVGAKVSLVVSTFTFQCHLIHSSHDEFS
jgi:hypothetical protein